MESKQKKPIETTDVMAALKEAGYSLVRKFARRGNVLTVYLKPTTLLGKDNSFRALDTCHALGLPASCRVAAQLPKDILVVTVTLPHPKKPAAQPAAVATKPTKKIN